MRVWRAYRSKKYLTRLLLSVIVLIVAVLVFASSALQYNAERNALRMQQESNRKVMNQIQYNIASTTDVMNNLVVSLFMDPNIMPLFTVRDADALAVIRSMNSLKQAYLSSPFLHSIVVYNGFDDRTFSVGDLGPEKPDAAKADRLAALLRQEKKLPQLQLLPMSFGDAGEGTDFFSIVIYQSFSETRASNESALVINVKPEWLSDNLQAMNDLAAPDRSGLFLLDGDGHPLLSSGMAMPDARKLLDGLNGRLPQGEKFGSFSSKLGGDEKQFVTYMSLSGTNWKVVAVQPYGIVLGGIGDMRNTSILLIAGSALVAILLSFLLAHKLYKPVDRLVREVGIGAETLREKGESAGDELTAVADVYSSMLTKLRSVSSERDRQRKIARNDFVHALILNGSSFTTAELASSIGQFGLSISSSGPYRVVLMKIDRHADFVRRSSSAERALCAFAIGNIAEEIVRPGGFRCEIADMRNDHIAMVVQPEQGAGEDMDALLPLLARVQDVVKSYYRLSLTLSVSERCEDHRTIGDGYHGANRNAAYRIVLGYGAIITPERVRANAMQEDYAFPEEAEKRLVESIRINQPQAMEETVAEILAELRTYHHDHIVRGILHLVDLFKGTVRDMNRNRIHTLQVDLSSLSRQALETETLEEIEALFRGVCHDIHEKTNLLEGEKNAALVEKIKEIIGAEYKDSNLSLQGIAATLHLTPAYVGRLFKTSMNVSVAEYVNEVRLQQARSLLETKRSSIKDIMEHVGYMNESTFFKLFKKSFGVTPKEYRLKKALE